MINVFLVDDHPIIREGINNLMSSTGAIKVVGEADSVGSVLAAYRNINWDVLILDISLPGIKSLELLKMIRLINPSERVLILSMHSNIDYIKNAKMFGAFGYIMKGSSKEIILDAIEAVYRGEIYFSNLDETKEPPHKKLSKREYEVFELLVFGSQQKVISEELGINIKTVSTYRSRVFLKLGVKNYPDLVRYALKHDLFSKN